VANKNFASAYADTRIIVQWLKLAVYDLVEFAGGVDLNAALEFGNNVLTCREMVWYSIDRDGHGMRMVMLTVSFGWCPGPCIGLIHKGCPS
jgi:hypothetical protein